MSVTDMVKNWIIRDIENGKYPEGSKLPSRHQLMNKYGIARATIDKIIDSLAEEGMIHSVKGSPDSSTQ